MRWTAGWADDASCAGFRMPAGREVAGSAEGRRPKAAREGTPAGAGRDSGGYGDLVVADGRGPRWGRA
jgi:hypothetical protein